MGLCLGLLCYFLLLAPRLKNSKPISGKVMFLTGYEGKLLVVKYVTKSLFEPSLCIIIDMIRILRVKKSYDHILLYNIVDMLVSMLNYLSITKTYIHVHVPETKKKDRKEKKEGHGENDGNILFKFNHLETYKRKEAVSLAASNHLKPLL